jgi:hypothetical protein
MRFNNTSVLIVNSLLSVLIFIIVNPCSEAVNNDPRLPPGFPKPLPLDKEEIKQTDVLIAEADGIIAKMDSLIAGLDLLLMQ